MVLSKLFGLFGLSGQSGHKNEPQKKESPMSMFCNQCEQTAKGTGCTTIGVCGKQPEVAALQDLTVYALRGLALVALEARKKGIVDPVIDHYGAKALFTTLTNVNFDPARFQAYIPARPRSSPPPPWTAWAPRPKSARSPPTRATRTSFR